MFEQTHPRTRVVAGAGAHRRLPELLADLNASSVYVVCGRTVGKGPQLAALREVLGDAIVGVFDEIRPQAGRSHLDAAAAAIRASGAEAVLSLGGGAAIDTAKYLILMLTVDGPLDGFTVPKGRGREGRPARALDGTACPHIAVPTTTGSSSEVMPWAGVRDEELGEKVLFRDPLLVPDVAVLDPELVVPTGAALTASSGVTAVARAVEATYSRDRQPIAEGYALQALHLLSTGLPRSIEAPGDLGARLDAQVGALLSGIAADNAMVSLTHAIGHAVGGRYALQHGVAHRIFLPPAAALLLPAAGSAVGRVAEAVGADGRDAEAVTAALRAMFAPLPIPTRLRDVNVDRADLPAIAEATSHEPMMAYLPREMKVEEIEELLESCW
ncbi:iron-containing alcohol dehydrogenase family protein [Actinomadura syzygii]|uniref:Iron-containing alcohol dehydrogenase n=1 Tax=Actinomadura syzygii TaxID=1427538 RepID=A0A5D0U843_9ACTN|nr:iron-containing alcohol dehydrogenase [Actinomadura syzygii]TYC13209.1 iron-containing alcohol dehydrogenase [Actinomadura syzygii]